MNYLNPLRKRTTFSLPMLLSVISKLLWVEVMVRKVTIANLQLHLYRIIVVNVLRSLIWLIGKNMVYTIHIIGEVVLSFGSLHWFENHHQPKNHQGMWSNMGYIDTPIGIVNKLRCLPIGMCGRFKSMFQCLLTHRNMWAPWEHIEIMVGFCVFLHLHPKAVFIWWPKESKLDTRLLFQVWRAIHDIPLLLNLYSPEQYSSMPINKYSSMP